jgi:hypothetical protein
LFSLLRRFTRTRAPSADSLIAENCVSRLAAYRQRRRARAQQPIQLFFMRVAMQNQLFTIYRPAIQTRATAASPGNQFFD